MSGSARQPGSSNSASIRIFPAAQAAGNFIIISLAPYPPTPTRIKSRRLHPIFTCRGRLFRSCKGFLMTASAEIPARILLAENDNDMRRFLVKALQNAGYSVASFDNGLSAYNRLREEPFE